jgi:tetratricopeptide (TPR) repeat protein
MDTRRQPRYLCTLINWPAQFHCEEFMAKPGRAEPKPSNEIARFTNRDDERKLFHHWVASATEPPVLMFYGIGGAGKSWLLKKLREETPRDLPTAFLDFDVQAGGQRFVLDPAAGLYEIRQQLDRPAPRFDLAFAMLRYKQGAAEERGLKGQGTLGFAADLAAELVQKSAEKVPGVNVVLDRLSKPLLERVKGSAIERFLGGEEAFQFVSVLRVRTSQEIGNGLLGYLAEDLRENLPVRLDRASRAVLLFDTFEALRAGLENTEHQRLREQWVRDVASNFEFALTVIAGQNQLTWQEADPEWANHLEQHLVGGLSQTDARQFLSKCTIDDAELQDAILATARETDSDDPAKVGHHCYSLGLCADIVHAERRAGLITVAATLRLRPGDREALARRFLKSLDSDQQRRWIERLALTPRFDGSAARAAFSPERSAAQDAEWGTLGGYSFVKALPGSPGWFAIRAQMRWALENQPSAGERVRADHEWWRSQWQSRSRSAADDAASLAWYHWYCVEPVTALQKWDRLALAARTEVPPRMQEHFSLLRWWEPVGLLEAPLSSAEAARACNILGIELDEASLGNRNANLRQAIACYEAALHVRTECDFPEDWAATQNNLGVAWWNLPTGNQEANLRQAIACHEAALRIYTERDFPQDWAMTQDNLGTTWWILPTGDREANLRKAIAHYEAALRVRTEQDFPQDWAATQNNLGLAWSDLVTGDRDANLSQAIARYETALRVRTARDFPQDRAMTQNNLGNAWSDLVTGDREANLHQAIACYEAALHVYTEQDFPPDWAMTQYNLGLAWAGLPTGDPEANLRRAIAYYDAALRIYTEPDFPPDWAMTQYNLGLAWAGLPTGDPEANLRRAIAHYDAALRIYTEPDFPSDWAMTRSDLGKAWTDLPTGDRKANLGQAVACYEAALRVFTEQDFPREHEQTASCLRLARAALILLHEL